MKKFILAALAIMTIGCTAQAQAYKNSRYYNQRTGHLDYSRRPGTGLYQSGENYYGLRIGPSFSTVSSDDKTLDGGNAQTGLNVGAVVGIALSDRAPVFFETGLYYTEKGGKKKLDDGKKMTYDLNYLEVPLTVKYAYPIDDHFSIQPFAGGYLARSRTLPSERPRVPSAATISAVWMAVCASVAASATICSMPTSPMTSALPTSATTVLTNRIMEPSCSISE